MKVVLFLSLFILIVTNAWCSTLEAEFEIDSKITSLKEGDVVNAVLRVWPIEEIDAGEFKKLQATSLFDSFYLAEVESIAPSVNNADVAEVKGTFVITGKVNPSKLSINYHDQIIHVRFKEVLINQLDSKANEFLIVDQDIDRNFKIYLIIIFILALGVLLFLKRDKILNFRKKVEKVDEKDVFATMFSQARNREDFESIYIQKEKWMKLLLEITPAHYEFFKVLNEHQYKKEWNQNVKKEVEESFEQIRRSFS